MFSCEDSFNVHMFSFDCERQTLFLWFEQFRVEFSCSRTYSVKKEHVPYLTFRCLSMKCQITTLGLVEINVKVFRLKTRLKAPVSNDTPVFDGSLMLGNVVCGWYLDGRPSGASRLFWGSIRLVTTRRLRMQIPAKIGEIGK